MACEHGGEHAMRPPEKATAPTSRYGRYVGGIGLVILVLITINTLLSTPNGADGIRPGQPLAPFALPLATGEMQGDANVASRPNSGAAGRRPACTVRGREILNICELYEQGPVVLALFVNSGACGAILPAMQRLSRDFPQVRFAAVAIKGQRADLRSVIHAQQLTIPVGIDRDGVLAALYKISSCPQINLAYPGGIVQSPALLGDTSTAVLRKRIQRLLVATESLRAPQSSGR